MNYLTVLKFFYIFVNYEGRHESVYGLVVGLNIRLTLLLFCVVIEREGQKKNLTRPYALRLTLIHIFQAFVELSMLA